MHLDMVCGCAKKLNVMEKEYHYYFILAVLNIDFLQLCLHTLKSN